jgi:hypothetical protein
VRTGLGVVSAVCACVALCAAPGSGGPDNGGSPG